MMLFNEFCSGNAYPEDVYGIFDLKTKKMLLTPHNNANGNIVQIAKILGYSPLNLEDKAFFCCINQTYKTT